jgi:hypothetical protein
MLGITLTLQPHESFVSSTARLWQTPWIVAYLTCGQAYRDLSVMDH